MQSSQPDQLQPPQLAVPLQDLSLLRNLRDSILAGTHPLFRVPARLDPLPYKARTAAPPRAEQGESAPAAAVDADVDTARDDGTTTATGDRTTVAETGSAARRRPSPEEEEGELVVTAPPVKAEQVSVALSTAASEATANVSAARVDKAQVEVLVLDDDDDDDDDDDVVMEVDPTAAQTQVADQDQQVSPREPDADRVAAADDGESLPDYVDSSDDDEDDFDPSILVARLPGSITTSSTTVPRPAAVEELVLDDDCVEQEEEDAADARTDPAAPPEPPLSTFRAPSPPNVNPRSTTSSVVGLVAPSTTSLAPITVVANDPQVPPAQRHAKALSLRLKLERERLAAAEARLAAARAASRATTPVPPAPASSNSSSSRVKSPAAATTTTTAETREADAKVIAPPSPLAAAAAASAPAVELAAPASAPAPPAPDPPVLAAPSRPSAPAAPSSDVVIVEATAPAETRKEGPRATKKEAVSNAPPPAAASRSQGRPDKHPASQPGKRGPPGPAHFHSRDEPPKRQRGGSDHRAGPPLPDPRPPFRGRSRSPPARPFDGRGGPPPSLRAAETGDGGGGGGHWRRYSEDDAEDLYRHSDRARGSDYGGGPWSPPSRSTPFGRSYSPPLAAPYGGDQRRSGRYSMSPPPPPPPPRRPFSPLGLSGSGHRSEFRQYTGAPPPPPMLPPQDRRDPRYRRSLSPPPPPLHPALARPRPPPGLADDFGAHAYLPRFDIPRPGFQRYTGPGPLLPADFDRPRSPPLFERMPPPLPQQATNRGPPPYDPRSRPVSPVLPPPGFRRPSSPLYDERRLLPPPPPSRQSYDDDPRSRDYDRDRRFDLPPTYLPSHYAPPPPPSGYPPPPPPVPADYERFGPREGAEYYPPRPPPDVSASRGAMPPQRPPSSMMGMPGRPPLPPPPGSRR
ncbi:hypothetical protein JCM3774_004450 [Rhodotorula dairenensis]